MQSDLGLLLLRIAMGGGMFYLHGLSKWTQFGQRASGFPDPLGVGSTFSLILVVFAEAVCALAVALGLWVRWTAIPVVVTMVVAAFLIHASDPLAKKELALLYGLGFSSVALLGSGRYSLDRFIRI